MQYMFGGSEGKSGPPVLYVIGIMATIRIVCALVCLNETKLNVNLYACHVSWWGLVANCSQDRNATLINSSHEELH